jgi:hypothetical protein
MKLRTRDNSDVALVVAWRARMLKMPIRSPALPSRGGINILLSNLTQAITTRL